MQDPTRKPRPDDLLGNLPRKKQEFIIRLFGQMSYRKILERLAKPEPEGLGIKVHFTSLHRFYTRNLHNHIMETRQELVSRLYPVAKAIDDTANPYPRVTCDLLEQYVLGLALNPEGSEDKLIRLSGLVLRMRSMDLRMRQFDLQYREKFGHQPFKYDEDGRRVDARRASEVACDQAINALVRGLLPNDTAKTQRNTPSRAPGRSPAAT